MIRHTLTGAAMALALATAAPAHAGAPAKCQEDAPCFTWSTMGNHKRGIATVDGAWRRIVGPCEFARLYRYIDWSRTPHLRGDATARRTGCAAYRPVAPETIY
jgi:hypothetical protein